MQFLIWQMSEMMYDLLAHDNHGFISCSHLHLIDISHELNQRGSDGRSFVFWPLQEVELCHSEGSLHSLNPCSLLLIDLKLPQVTVSISLLGKKLD